MASGDLLDDLIQMAEWHLEEAVARVRRGKKLVRQFERNRSPELTNTARNMLKGFEANVVLAQAHLNRLKQKSRSK